MVTHTLNLCSAFNPSKVHTHTHTHTHTPGAVAAIYLVGGSVSCSRAPRRGIEGGESAVHSLPLPTIPAGPRLELSTFQLRVQLSNHSAMT